MPVMETSDLTPRQYWEQVKANPNRAKSSVTSGKSASRVFACTRRGASITFSATVSSSTRLNLWKMKPMFSLRISASRFSE